MGERYIAGRKLRSISHLKSFENAQTLISFEIPLPPFYQYSTFSALLHHQNPAQYLLSIQKLYEQTYKFEFQYYRFQKENYNKESFGRQ